MVLYYISNLTTDVCCFQVTDVHHYTVMNEVVSALKKIMHSMHGMPKHLQILNAYNVLVKGAKYVCSVLCTYAFMCVYICVNVTC